MRLLSPLVVLASAAVSTAAPPNVVLVIGDDQGWTDYGFMGHPHVKTPNIDRLAAESRTFRSGYVPTSLCRASLATVITGLYPHQHFITSNDPPIPPGVPAAKRPTDPTWLAGRAAMVSLFESKPNLAKLLGATGYVTLQTGKWWEGEACRCGGFTEGMTHGDPAKGGRHGDKGLAIGREGLTEVFEFIDSAKAKGKPFFIWYAPMMPHQPHNPPPRLAAKYKGKDPSAFVTKYWAMCEWFDETVGDVLKKLDDAGVAKDTLVIFLHDNGWIQDPKAGQYAPRSKRSPYDGGVRTPILVRWPGKVTPAESAAVVSSVDIAPTVLAACGLRPTAEMPGVNLLDPKAVADRKAVFGATFTHNAIDVKNPAKNLEFRWVRHDGWKLIVPDKTNSPAEKVELFNLSIDPKEETNRAVNDTAKVKELTAILDGWWRGK